MKKWICLLIAAALLGGCGPQKQPVNSVSSESSSISSTSVAEPVELPELTVSLETGTPCVHHNSRFHILPHPFTNGWRRTGKAAVLKK